MPNLFDGTIQEESYTRFKHMQQLSLYLLLHEQYRLFNEGSRGALTLSGANLQGDFEEEINWKIAGALVRSRQPGDDTDIDTVGREQFEHTAVRFASGTYPFDLDPDLIKWINEAPDTAASMFSQKFAEELYYYQVNAAISGLIAAYLNVSDAINDISADTTSTIDISPLIDTASLFGDRASSLSTWIVHSKPYSDYLKARAANNDRLVTYGNINVTVDAFGRIFIVTDNENLRYTSGGVTYYYTLGLRPGAVELRHGDDFVSNISVTNGKTNIQRTLQSEWSDQLNIPGFNWKKASGGKAPLPAALASSSNWELDDSSIPVKALNCAILKSL